MFASAKHRLLYSKENKRCSALDCLSTLRAGLVSRNPGDVLTSPAAQQLPQQSIRAWAYPAFPVVTQAQGRAQGLGAQQLWACARSRFAGETTVITPSCTAWGGEFVPPWEGRASSSPN